MTGFIIEALIALAFFFLLHWAFTLYLLQRIRTHEGVARERVTKTALEQFGQELFVRMDGRFDAMEAAQAKREEQRMAYLLKNAEELGGVRSTNQLLTGQLATLSAKLDRQIEIRKLTHPEE